MKFNDLFAGLGGFRVALERLGHECVFASDIDSQLQEVYIRNFSAGTPIHGDIRLSKRHIPSHDLLCAGFPCQPFSKSGGTGWSERPDEWNPLPRDTRDFGKAQAELCNPLRMLGTLNATTKDEHGA